MKKKKFAYLFFHLNLFFSSLPERKRKEVIKKCYWPLLNLIDKSNFKIGIEITGWTLNEIKKLDNNWIIYFKKLLKEKKTYLIGSSYSQSIFPLVPAEVNSYNIKYGKNIYKKILNQTPTIAYVNEQCFSKSIVDLFKSAKYKTLIMDWDCVKNSSNLNKKYKFYVQKLNGNTSTINVLWNSSLNFQNFQKVAHSRLDLKEYLETFNKTNTFSEGIVNIYGSDAEIFDFRLKRFENEGQLLDQNQSEWSKIHIILNKLSKSLNIINPNDLLKIKFNSKYQNQLIDITSLKNNLPTKKQKKYNPLRWLIGGRDNFTINTICWKIYLKGKKNINDIKKLCYYWSSDFRTHIEKNRWRHFYNKIKKSNRKSVIKNFITKIKRSDLEKEIYNLEEGENFIKYDDGKYYFTLDKERGLSLNNYGIIKKNEYQTYLRKYNQGYFDSYRLNADFYNGHNLVENSNLKFSDLDQRGKIYIAKKKNFIIISNEFFKKDLIKISKKWYFDTYNKIFYLHNKIKLFKLDFLVIRSNYFNLNNQLFDFNKMKISTKNGGFHKEIFFVKGNKNFFHDDPLSSKFSAQNCFGNTDGQITFGDNKKEITFKLLHEFGSSAPMLNYLKDKNNTYFLRFLTSFRENNDVKREFNNKNFESLISIKINK